jgi:hypothetical protein
VRIDDELARDAGVEVFVTFRRLLKIDHLDIDDLGDGQSVPKYRLHELPIVFEHRRLAGMERVRFCPTETEAKARLRCLAACSFAPDRWSHTGRDCR